MYENMVMMLRLNFFTAMPQVLILLVHRVPSFNTSRPLQQMKSWLYQDPWFFVATVIREKWNLYKGFIFSSFLSFYSLTYSTKPKTVQTLHLTASSVTFSPFISVHQWALPTSKSLLFSNFIAMFIFLDIALDMVLPCCLIMLYFSVIRNLFSCIKTLESIL